MKKILDIFDKIFWNVTYISIVITLILICCVPIVLIIELITWLINL